MRLTATVNRKFPPEKEMETKHEKTQYCVVTTCCPLP